MLLCGREWSWKYFAQYIFCEQTKACSQKIRQIVQSCLHLAQSGVQGLVWTDPERSPLPDLCEKVIDVIHIRLAGWGVDDGLY